MIASYLLSSSAGPGFLHVADAGGASRRRTRRDLRAPPHVLRPLSARRAAIPLAADHCLSRLRAGIAVSLLPHMGTELFPDAHAPLLRIRLRAPAGTRIEETERIVMHALDVIQHEAGPNNIRITSDFLGPDPVQLPGRPDSPVHQRAARGYHPGGSHSGRPARRSASRETYARLCIASYPARKSLLKPATS